MVGDVNATVTDDARVALLAPQITALSPNFDMTEWAWGVGGPTPTASATLTWNASLFSSWASDDRLQRNPAQHVLRQIEGGVSVNVTGSVVAMFTRGQYNSLNTFNKKKGGYEGKGGSSSARPDPQVAGLPVFTSTIPGELARRAGGTLRYPGDGNRDLRFAARNRQPPASPRLSIDPAPVDRR